tara:strand:- start:174 stop:1001 length:828 start_codon:yes stop_codon:yes gene_type:complete
MEQTREICPADRKIYALRNSTGTVASLPLICGSIMSKKIAEGIQGLVLDIKVGNGAFMKTLSQAKELGSLLREVGELYGLKVSLCFTDMNQPLGNTAGLWCEVFESIECLEGNGPDDLMAVIYCLGESALTLAGVDDPIGKLESAISDGSALEKFKQMVTAHDGLPRSSDETSVHEPKFRKKIFAEKDGFITGMNTLELGNAVIRLGGGRVKKDDILDPTVGIIFHKKVGDIVHAGERMLEYFCSNPNKFETGANLFKSIFTVQPNEPNSPSLFY